MCVCAHKIADEERDFMCIFESSWYQKKKKVETVEPCEILVGLKGRGCNMFYTPLPFFWTIFIISIPDKNMLDCDFYFIYLYNSLIFELLNKLLKAGFSYSINGAKQLGFSPIAIPSILECGT